MKAILFNGPPQSGKDTAVRLLAKHLTASNNYMPICLKMAYPIKAAVHAFAGLDVEDDFFEDMKDRPCDPLLGATPRELYIAFGENFLKPHFGKNALGRIFVNRMLQYDDAFYDPKEVVVLCSDIGFIEEVEEVVDALGINNILMFTMHRVGTSFAGDSRDYVDYRTVTNHLIYNNGDIDDLRGTITGSVDMWLKAANG